MLNGPIRFGRLTPGKLKPNVFGFMDRRTKLAPPFRSGKKTERACVSRPWASTARSPATVTAGVLVDAAATTSPSDSLTAVRAVSCAATPEASPSPRSTASMPIFPTSPGPRDACLVHIHCPLSARLPQHENQRDDTEHDDAHESEDLLEGQHHALALDHEPQRRDSAALRR